MEGLEWPGGRASPFRTVMLDSTRIRASVFSMSLFRRKFGNHAKNCACRFQTSTIRVKILRLPKGGHSPHSVNLIEKSYWGLGIPRPGDIYIIVRKLSQGGDKPALIGYIQN